MGARRSWEGWPFRSDVRTLPQHPIPGRTERENHRPPTLWASTPPGPPVLPRSDHETRSARPYCPALPRHVHRRTRSPDRGGGRPCVQAESGRAGLRRSTRCARGHARHHGRPPSALHARSGTARPARGRRRPVRVAAPGERGPAQDPHHRRSLGGPSAGHGPDHRARRRRQHGGSVLPLQSRAGPGLRRPSGPGPHERLQPLSARRRVDDGGLDPGHERSHARHAVEPDGHDHPLRRAGTHLRAGADPRGLADRR